MTLNKKFNVLLSLVVISAIVIFQVVIFPKVIGGEHQLKVWCATWLVIPIVPIWAFFFLLAWEVKLRVSRSWNNALYDSFLKDDD